MDFVALKKFNNQINNSKELKKDLLKYYKLSCFIGKLSKIGLTDNRLFFRKTILLEDLAYKIKNELREVKGEATDFSSKESEIEKYKKIKDFSWFVFKPFLFLSLLNSFINNPILSVIPLSATTLSLGAMFFSFLKLKHLKKEEEILKSTLKSIMNYY